MFTHFKAPAQVSECFWTRQWNATCPNAAPESRPFQNASMNCDPKRACDRAKLYSQNSDPHPKTLSTACLPPPPHFRNGSGHGSAASPTPSDLSPRCAPDLHPALYAPRPAPSPPLHYCPDISGAEATLGRQQALHLPIHRRAVPGLPSCAALRRHLALPSGRHRGAREGAPALRGVEDSFESELLSRSC
eukprot:366259-Chlamydomonas_euryale.AAC.18